MRHIPNIISSIRILMIPLIMWQYSIGNHVTAALLLGASGLTDLLDGNLARKYGWTSQLGKVLDPAADKLTLVSVCVLLVIKLNEYRIFFLILLGKDLIMLLLGGNLIRKGVALEGARWFGKIATVLFYLGMVVLWLFDLPHGANLAILSVITIMELVSAALYLPDYLEYRKQHAKQK